MEFEEMKKIWDTQNNEMLFAINEEALHKRVKAKKKQANRIVSTTEIGLISISTTTSIVLLIDAILDKEGIWDYGGAAVMFLTGMFLLLMRMRRKKAQNRFDRSMLGELDHAIADTQFVLKIASTMIWWYFIPIGIFSLGKMAYFGASLEKWLLIAGAFILAFTLTNWEKRRCHVPRMAHLQTLRKKLIEEVE